MSTTETETRTMFQDGSTDTYECGPRSCDYTGDTYCQECGYGADEREPATDAAASRPGLTRKDHDS